MNEITLHMLSSGLRHSFDCPLVRWSCRGPSRGNSPAQTRPPPYTLSLLGQLCPKCCRTDGRSRWGQLEKTPPGPCPLQKQSFRRGSGLDCTVRPPLCQGMHASPSPRVVPFSLSPPGRKCPPLPPSGHKEGPPVHCTGARERSDVSLALATSTPRTPGEPSTGAPASVLRWERHGARIRILGAAGTQGLVTVTLEL